MLSEEPTNFFSQRMMVSISAGWLHGNLTTNAFSQWPAKNADCHNSIHLPSISVNGETLPTIMLTEFSIIAKKQISYKLRISTIQKTNNTWKLKHKTQKKRKKQKK